MTPRPTVIRFVLAGLLAGLSAGGAGAETFRWAAATDPQTMDPHAANLAPVTSFLNNVYEGLVRRAPDMSIEPSLATSWEPLSEGDGWRFRLREGVTFHDGSAFTADDVLFSYERATSEQSDVRSWFAPVEEVVVVDDHTIDFSTRAPDPIFPESIANFMILDRDWAEANGAEAPARDAETFATRNANGTGPFTLEERDPGVATRLAPHDGWWDEQRPAIEDAVFTPIASPATAVAALLSGEIDLLSSVPVQDADRLGQTDGIRLVEGLEARNIMLGFDQESATLGDGETPNPFLDPRVREAVAHAVQVEAIDRVLMGGRAEPAGQLTPAGLSGYSDDLGERWAFDPDRARALLADAGYPDGFAFDFKCTNDRYLNDEAVCQAIAAMLSQVGLEPRLETMPVSRYWSELREGRAAMYLLGWSPGTFDAEHPLRFLAHTRQGELGTWNFGGYSNERIDELLPSIQRELDADQRQAMLNEAAQILREEVAYVPLYTEPLIWAAREGVRAVQRPDNFVQLRLIALD